MHNIVKYKLSLEIDDVSKSVSFPQNCLLYTRIYHRIKIPHIIHYNFILYSMPTHSREASTTP